MTDWSITDVAEIAVSISIVVAIIKASEIKLKFGKKLTVKWKRQIK